MDTLNGAPLRLRRVCAADRSFLYALYASTREDTLALLPWTAAQKQDFLALQFEAQHHFYQEQFAQAAFDLILLDERPIGRLYVDRREDAIHVIDLALLPEWRNRGIGTGLLKETLVEGEQAGKPVRLRVEQSNPALRLYRRLGFVGIGDDGVYTLMEWTPFAQAIAFCR